MFFGPLYLAVTCSLRCLKYMIWIIWDDFRIISVCNALGSTVGTCFCQSTRLWGVSHIFHVNVNSDPEGHVLVVSVNRDRSSQCIDSVHVALLRLSNKITSCRMSWRNRL